jgi:hypothetical protein
LVGVGLGRVAAVGVGLAGAVRVGSGGPGGLADGDRVGTGWSVGTGDEVTVGFGDGDPVRAGDGDARTVRARADPLPITALAEPGRDDADEPQAATGIPNATINPTTATNGAKPAVQAALRRKPIGIIRPPDSAALTRICVIFRNFSYGSSGYMTKAPNAR